MDQVDAALRPCEKFSDIRAFVVGSVVPDHVDQAFIGVTCLDSGEKLRGADPVDGGRFTKGCIEVLKIERTMDVGFVATIMALAS